MTDMTPQFFDDADKLCAACRERPAFFAPDKVGADASEAAVAATRAAWAAHLRERYTPRVVEFIDTGVGQQKQACVAVLRPDGGGGLPVEKPLVLGAVARIEGGDRLPPHRHDAEPARARARFGRDALAGGRRPQSPAPPAGCCARTPAAMATATKSLRRRRRARAARPRRRARRGIARGARRRRPPRDRRALAGRLARHLVRLRLTRALGGGARGGRDARHVRRAALLHRGLPRGRSRRTSAPAASRRCACSSTAISSRATRRAGSARRTASAGGSSSTRTPTPSGRSPTTPTPTTAAGATPAPACPRRRARPPTRRTRATRCCWVGWTRAPAASARDGAHRARRCAVDRPLAWLSMSAGLPFGSVSKSGGPAAHVPGARGAERHEPNEHRVHRPEMSGRSSDLDASHF